MPGNCPHSTPKSKIDPKEGKVAGSTPGKTERPNNSTLNFWPSFRLINFYNPAQSEQSCFSKILEIKQIWWFFFLFPRKVQNKIPTRANFCCPSLRQRRLFCPRTPFLFVSSENARNSLTQESSSFFSDQVSKQFKNFYLPQRLHDTKQIDHWGLPLKFEFLTLNLRRHTYIEISINLRYF